MCEYNGKILTLVLNMKHPISSGYMRVIPLEIRDDFSAMSKSLERRLQDLGFVWCL